MPTMPAGYRSHVAASEHPRTSATHGVDELVERLRTFPWKPLPLPVNAAFGRQFIADSSVLVLGNQQRFSSPHNYPRTWERRTVHGHDGLPLAATVAMQPGPAPMLVICHGLCMTMRFRAVIKLARHAFENWGWHVAVYDARGCGQSAWLSDEQMTGGYLEGEDLVAIARDLRSDERVQAVHAVGISLGGSSVLNGARVESSARDRGEAPALDSVVSVSGPTMINEAIDHISTPPRFGSDFWPLFRLFRLAIHVNSRRIGLSPGDATWRHASTAFLEMLEDAPDPTEFYSRASAALWADQIRIPTLQLHAEDDFCVPVFHARALEEAATDNPHVHVWVQPRGNHAAFDAVARRWYRSVLRRWCEHWTTAASHARAERD